MALTLPIVATPLYKSFEKDGLFAFEELAFEELAFEELAFEDIFFIIINKKNLINSF
jgi:hypothetical protein